ncbi:hypothetical protein HMPREF1544_04893 [Mucor circinelloides 1006PhL]|uniref:Uncharacterized protein n=1 Tax=Mucor circinelloides f. circinelloides (strain 1006PhL) TaxID=1220926 RepID=S2JEL7_MUCC1|nr:hypothetical protein HMPREF1544_04893 [Mucor circinelloides 1006PhL]
MDIVNQQQQHHYENTKELLMKRLADASQYKIYPSIIPRNELPLRKILLTTRLWNHVRRQQAMLTMSSTADEWLFEQESSNEIIPIKEEEEEKEEEPEKTENHSHKRRIDDEPEQLQIKKPKSSNNNNTFHQHFIDSPASPAGPVSSLSPTSSSAPPPATSNSPAVLLSA